jgi:hypothetical protein
LRYALVQELVGRGLSRGAIARQLRMDPHTVRRFANATSIEELLVNTGRRDSIIDAFRPYLHQRWNEGCTDAAVLHHEICQQGFTGSDQTVRRYVDPFRATLAGPPAPPTAPKTRHVTRWIMTDPGNLDADDQVQLDAISGRSPAIATLIGHVSAFAAMMTKRTGVRDLPQWIDKAHASGLAGQKSFAAGDSTRPRHCHQRPEPALQFGPRGRPREPHQNDQAADVGLGQLRSAPPPRPGPLLTETSPPR